MSDLDPSAQARVDEIVASLRAGIPLSDMPPTGSPDTTDTKGKELYREPASDPKRHPFEVYVTGYTNSDQDHAKVFVAWGTVLASEDDVTGVHAIAHKDDSFTITDTDWIWLECVFDLAGAITSLDLKAGGTWADYPALYRDDGPTGNTWYQPIAHS